MLESIWNFIVSIFMWPWDLVHYGIGFAVIYTISILVATVIEHGRISLLTPFRILPTMFKEDPGCAIFFICAFWGPILWLLPIAGICMVGIWAYEEGETGWPNRLRAWMDSKCLVDFKNKDQIR